MSILYASLLMLSLVLPGGNGHGLCVLLHSSIIKKIGDNSHGLFPWPYWMILKYKEQASFIYISSDGAQCLTYIWDSVSGMRCELTVYYVIYQCILICSYSETIGLRFLRWDWISKWKVFKHLEVPMKYVFNNTIIIPVIILQAQSWLM